MKYLSGRVDEKTIKIAKRAAKEIEEGMVVSLGSGIPTLVENHLPNYLKVCIHSVSGALGCKQVGDDIDPDLIGSSYEAISLVEGGLVTQQSQAYDILRGGHCDLLIVGGIQVSREGDLAN